MAGGLYIHIPFCKSRCIYCDFFSTTGREELRDAYTDALLGELRERGGGPFSTIYIGGGTPSWLGGERLVRLCSGLRADEFTIECNPDDVSDDLVGALRQTAVNRVSLGVQSLTDERLRLIGRRHSSEQAARAVRLLQSAGYHNISIDLIYGLPGQTMDEWKRDLDKALRLGTPHLSAYSLMYERGTALWQLRERHKVTEAHEDLSRDMYAHLIDTCAGEGLTQYEISNFARCGFESRHNLSYWQGLPYTGIGAGAHSYDGLRTRRYNLNDLDAYIAHFGGGEGILKTPRPLDERSTDIASIETLTDDERFNERVFTALRTRRGLDWGSLQQNFPRQSAAIEPIVRRHTHYGNLTWENEQVRLTRQSLFVSDDVMSDLMIV